ncbi:MAG: TatD family hydrolase, partial [Raoultibacter sp.]
MVDRSEPLFYDALFRNKKKKGDLCIVEVPVPPLEAPVADSHAHLALLGDPALALARCALHGVQFVVAMEDVFEDNALDYEMLTAWRAEAERIIPEVEAATRLALAHDGEGVSYRASTCPIAVPHVRIAIGCHPHNAKDYDDALEAQLRERLRDPRTCAVGEVGLDYHYDFSPRDVQRDVFRRQIRLAHETGLPLILHLREAHDEAYELMVEEGFPQAGVLLHCYNLDWETLKPWAERGCYAAFGGPLTFKKADEVREAAKHLPLNRILTETDAPYMTPEPMRGMNCGPEHTVFTAA